MEADVCVWHYSLLVVHARKEEEEEEEEFLQQMCESFQAYLPLLHVGRGNVLIYVCPPVSRITKKTMGGFS